MLINKQQRSINTDHSDVAVPSYAGHQGGSTGRTPLQQGPGAHSPTQTQPYTTKMVATTPSVTMQLLYTV